MLVSCISVHQTAREGLSSMRAYGKRRVRHTHTQSNTCNRFCKAVSCLIVVAGNSCGVSLRSFVMGNKTQQSKNKLPGSTGSCCCYGETNLTGQLWKDKNGNLLWKTASIFCGKMKGCEGTGTGVYKPGMNETWQICVKRVTLFLISPPG